MAMVKIEYVSPLVPYKNVVSLWLFPIIELFVFGIWIIPMSIPVLLSKFGILVPGALIVELKKLSGLGIDPLAFLLKVV